MLLSWLTNSTTALLTAAAQHNRTAAHRALSAAASYAAQQLQPHSGCFQQQQQQQQQHKATTFMTTGHCQPLPVQRWQQQQLKHHHQPPQHPQQQQLELLQSLPHQAGASAAMRVLTGSSSEQQAAATRRASPGGPKTAKRRAAEALLAAQYGCGLSGSDDSGSSPSTADAQCRLFTTASKAFASAAGGGGGSTGSDSESDQHMNMQQQQQRSSVAGAILKLGGDAAAATPRNVRQRTTPPQQSSLHSEAAASAALASAAAAATGTPGTPRQQQRSVQVPACAEDCQHSLTHGWCHTQVRLPDVDWSRVMGCDMATAPSFKVAAGYEKLTLPGGVQVLVVSDQVHLDAALGLLRASMLDEVVAIDLEWRPQFGKGFTPVAMVQLATSTTAVLVRTCRMGYKLPPVLRAFLQDASVRLVGFSWAMADEGKMQSTFGMGNKDFGRFTDLQRVAQGLGYHSFGLARLARQVLGMNMPKSKRVSMSNWEAASLTRTQLKYAALDVLIAGQVFRALRLWHSSPSVCEVCHYNLGSTHSSGSMACGDCGKGFLYVKDYLSHCQRTGHAPQWAECEGCGCARQLPWPSGVRPAQLDEWAQQAACAAAAASAGSSEAPAVVGAAAGKDAGDESA